MKAMQIGSLALRKDNGDFMPSVKIYIGVPEDMEMDYARRCAEAAREVLFKDERLPSFLEHNPGA